MAVSDIPSYGPGVDLPKGTSESPKQSVTLDYSDLNVTYIL